MTDTPEASGQGCGGQLTPEQHYICRQKGTEPAFSGQYTDCEDPGIYACVCCGNELFDADKKYHSGSGWPSFWEALRADSVSEVPDNSHSMRRIEVQCKACAAHLGHVFPDGPPPTGLRYCINSLALTLKPE